MKDELQKCNCDLVKLSTEAKAKEDELKILKEFKKELEVLCHSYIASALAHTLISVSRHRVITVYHSIEPPSA